jgi:hypothetical protein
MNKEQQELLKAANFPLIHPTSIDNPFDKTVKSTPTKNATTTTRSSTQKENTVTTMTTETVSQNDVKSTPITTQRKDTSCNKKISNPPVKKVGVGNYHSPTPPLSTRSSTRKKDTTMKKTTESNSLFLISSILQVDKTKNRVGNNCSPTRTKLPAVITKTKVVTST